MWIRPMAELGSKYKFRTLPCHSTVGWYGREQDGIGGNRKELDDRSYAGA